MIELSAVFDAYINANILLIVGLALWFCAKWIMSRAGLKAAYLTQLKLLNGAFLAILACPFAAAAYVFATNSGLLPHEYSINLSDMVVAQYLDGNVAMTPSEFEYALSLRETATAAILSFQMPAIQALGALLAIMSGSIVWRMAQSVLSLRRIISQSFLWRRIGKVEIRLSDKIFVPFSTRGLRRRYIVVPSAMLTQSEDLKIAMAHEFHHLRNSDIEWEIALEAMKPLFFWNPAFHIWKRNVEHLRELACDQAILSRTKVNPRDYGECLLRVCKGAIKRDWGETVLMPRVALVEVERPQLLRRSDLFMRKRVASIMAADPRHVDPRFAKRGVWMSLPLIVLILFAGISIQKPGDWSHDRLMLSTIVNLERMELINGLGVRP